MGRSGPGSLHARAPVAGHDGKTAGGFGRRLHATHPQTTYRYVDTLSLSPINAHRALERYSLVLALLTWTYSNHSLIVGSITGLVNKATKPRGRNGPLDAHLCRNADMAVGLVLPPRYHGSSVKRGASAQHPSRRPTSRSI